MSMTKRRMFAIEEVRELLSHFEGDLVGVNVENLVNSFHRIHQVLNWLSDEKFLEIYNTKMIYVSYWTPISTGNNSEPVNTLANKSDSSTVGQSYAVDKTKVDFLMSQEFVESKIAAAFKMARNMQKWLGDPLLTEDPHTTPIPKEKLKYKLDPEKLLIFGENASNHVFGVSMALSDIEAKLCQISGKNRILEFSELRSVVLKISQILDNQVVSNVDALELEFEHLQEKLLNVEQERDRLAKLLELREHKSEAIDCMKSSFYTSLGAVPILALTGFVALLFDPTKANDVVTSLEVFHEYFSKVK